VANGVQLGPQVEDWGDKNMVRNFIFQINPQTQYELSRALGDMKGRGTKALILSQHRKANTKLECKDIVYLWESTSKNPAQPAHLVARGEITHVWDTDKDMPPWQHVYCVGGHKPMPRVEVEIVKQSAGQPVSRDITDQNQILSKIPFLKKGTNAYQITIVTLTEAQAQELDRLAAW
jgi:hypothetical protein